MKNNLKKLKEILLTDNKTKIYAVLLAIVIWLVVTMSLYPDTTITIRNIPVDINVSDTYVNEMGLNVVSGDDKTVTVKLRGNRSVIGSLNAKDLSATVSLDGIQTAAEYDLAVTVAPKDSSVRCEILDVSPSSVKVKFDNVVSKTYEVQCQTSAVIPDNYVMGTLECSPKTIKITGPEEKIDKIASCVAFAATGSLTETTSVAASIMLYDTEKNQISTDGFAFSTTDFAVTIPVYAKKTVPFEITYRNVPKTFDTSKLSYTLSSNEIEIASTSEILAKIDKLSLSYIDFRDIKIGSSFVLDVVLPSGIQNISGTQTVEVSYNTDGFVSKEFSVSDISVLNTPSGYDVSLLTNVLQSVTLVGPKSVMEELTVNDIVAEIDLSSAAITDGTQTVAVNIYVKDKGTVWATGDYNATITASAHTTENE